MNQKRKGETSTEDQTQSSGRQQYGQDEFEALVARVANLEKLVASGGFSGTPHSDMSGHMDTEEARLRREHEKYMQQHGSHLKS